MSTSLSTRFYETNRSKFGTAIILGHTTATSIKIWARTYKPGDWWMVVVLAPLDLEKVDLVRLGEKKVDAYLKSAGVDQAGAQKLSFLPATDNTNTFEFTGLAPATKYHYYLIADTNDVEEVPRRTEVGFESRHSFRTMREAPDSLVFGFYSCHDPFSVPGHSEGLWPQFYDLLIQRRADFAIGGGDQVYVDTNQPEDMPDIWKWLRENKTELVRRFSTNGKLDTDVVTRHLLDIYHQYYRFYWAFPNLLKTYKALPQYMIWDDHEILDGWGSLKRSERAARLNRLLQDDDPKINRQLVDCLFRAAITAYRNYQHSHNPTTPADPTDPDNAIWDYHMHFGAFSFYAFDMRGHHDIENPPNRILGPAQLQRFLAWMDAKETKMAKAVFILSPVPIVHWNESFVNTADIGSAKDDFRDEWGHQTNHAERNRILDKILKRSHERRQAVVVLSGDVHSASAFRIAKPDELPDARVYNVTASGISRKPAPAIAELGILRDGPIEGYAGGRFEKLYMHAGSHNFALASARLNDAGEAEVFIELYHSRNGSGEIIVKHLAL